MSELEEVAREKGLTRYRGGLTKAALIKLLDTGRVNAEDISPGFLKTLLERRGVEASLCSNKIDVTAFLREE